MWLKGGFTAALSGHASVIGWQGPLADRAKLLCQSEDTFKQDLSMQSRVELITTLPHVSPLACLP